MKILHVSQSDKDGGAARAAFRIMQAQRAIGMDSTMLVDTTQLPNEGVHLPKPNAQRVLRRFISPIINVLTARLQKGINKNLHSPAIFSSMSIKEINSSDADVVNLHWTAGGMLSVYAISRIKKPAVWTLHDMWAFSGSEHYDAGSYRWVNGYHKKSRPNSEKGIDVDRIVWNLKKFLWRKKFTIVAPSTWLQESVAQSSLMSDWEVFKIPYPINLGTWKEENKNIARDLLGISEGPPIILFGAIGGTRDERKGFNLFVDAVNILAKKDPTIRVVVFGEQTTDISGVLEAEVIFLGSLQDDLSLRLAYSAADVFVIPSIQEAFGQTALEAMSCGRPVVGFMVGGISDLISHEETGYLANPFDTEDLASGMQWALNLRDPVATSKACRVRVESLFNEQKIAMAYKDLYRKVLGRMNESGKDI
jgi:glycosyltransferase involved in cell wall biosynthesis